MLFLEYCYDKLGSKLDKEVQENSPTITTENDGIGYTEYGGYNKYDKGNDVLVANPEQLVIVLDGLSKRFAYYFNNFLNKEGYEGQLFIDSLTADYSSWYYVDWEVYNSRVHDGDLYITIDFVNII